jgi:hypothetical protein
LKPYELYANLPRFEASWKSAVENCGGSAGRNSVRFGDRSKGQSPVVRSSAATGNYIAKYMSKSSDRENYRLSGCSKNIVYKIGGNVTDVPEQVGVCSYPMKYANLYHVRMTKGLWSAFVDAYNFLLDYINSIPQWQNLAM